MCKEGLYEPILSDYQEIWLRGKKAKYQRAYKYRVLLFV